PGLRRDGRVEAAFARGTRRVPGGPADRRRHVGARPWLGPVAGGRGACLLHPGEQPGPVPRGAELARAGAVRTEEALTRSERESVAARGVTPQLFSLPDPRRVRGFAR